MVTSIDRYLRRWVVLPDGRRIYGRDPGRSFVTQVEHVLRDELARTVRGVVEAVLPFGRADLLTTQAVFEVEPARQWRSGVRQALTYAAQTGLSPTVALFGAAHRDLVLKTYLTLRDNGFGVGLWWFDGRVWRNIHARTQCLTMRAPDDQLLAAARLAREPDPVAADDLP
jgi:hypothetical protein